MENEPICSRCGVQLEKDMRFCPICGLPAGSVSPPDTEQNVRYRNTERESMSQPQRVRVWEIISITLLSAIFATLIINYIHSGDISWSEYPVAVSLVIFSYVSLIAFWKQRPFIQLLGGMVLSAILLVLFDLLTGKVRWSLEFALPLLVGFNIIIALFLIVVRLSKYKGINLLAWGFVVIAAFCMAIEGVLTRYSTGTFSLRWSIIVAACILPVVLVLLFLHFRFKRGRSLQKTFHV